MRCRHCGFALLHNLIDLGFAPPSNSYLAEEDLSKPETYYPLKIRVCHNCWLVQTEDFVAADKMFTPDYAYFSSASESYLVHAAEYVAKMTKELSLGKDSFVIEIGSNDGYLLRNFVALGIPCLGVEPSTQTAKVAKSLGVQVVHKFFSSTTARTLPKADLILGNNVYAHVPDINDFTAGMKIALKEGGTITLQFPHLTNLLKETQFDTIYHEHFSYLSLCAVARIFSSVGLRVFDVEELPIHGGSLRVYGCHDDDPRTTTPAAFALLVQEQKDGLCSLAGYQSFQEQADKIKNDLLYFLIDMKRHGKMVAAYGAAAKGNTFLNYAGIKPDLVPFVCDDTKAKQGKYMPGSHIPILSQEDLLTRHFDYLLVLPWNHVEEIKKRNQILSVCEVKVITAIPELKIHPW